MMKKPPPPPLVDGRKCTPSPPPTGVKPSRRESQHQAHLLVELMKGMHTSGPPFYCVDLFSLCLDFCTSMFPMSQSLWDNKHLLKSSHTTTFPPLFFCMTSTAQWSSERVGPSEASTTSKRWETVPVKMQAWPALEQNSGTQAVIESPHRTLELQSCVLVHSCAWSTPQVQLWG